MPAYRCSHCSLDWPADPETYVTWYDDRNYQDVCVRCLAPVAYFPSKSSIKISDAKAIAGEAEFERRYEVREKARIERRAPSPEQLGELDALEEIPDIRAWLNTLAEIRALPEALKRAPVS